MRKLTKFTLALLFALPVTGYSMSSIDALLNFDWLKIFTLGFWSSGEQATTTRPIPLPAIGSHPEQHVSELSLQTFPPELVGNIISHLTPEDRSNFALTSHLQRVQVQSTITHLTIPLQDITPEILKDARAKFPLVKSLTVKGYSITANHLALLARTFPNIQSLNLSNTGITAKSVRVLSQLGVFTSLKQLDLSHNWTVKDEVIDCLSEAPFAAQLESLNLAETDITADAVRILSEPGLFMSLKKLDLSRNWMIIGNAVINHLSKAPFAGKLELLNMPETGITAEGVRVLSQSGVFTSLKELDLSQNKIKDEAKEYLNKAPFAKHVKIVYWD